MQNPTQYAPCPNCGQSNAQKVSFTWWGGVLGPRLFTHVRCQNCGKEYNGKTGKFNDSNIHIYFLVSVVLVLCICAGIVMFSILPVLLNQ